MKKFIISTLLGWASSMCFIIGTVPYIVHESTARSIFMLVCYLIGFAVMDLYAYYKYRK